MGDWREVADGVLIRRYAEEDLTAAVVRGPDGLLVVDTRASPTQAAELADHLTELGPLPVRAVVNTHAHYDHTFGNQHFAPAVPIYGHHLLPRHHADYERPRLAVWREEEPERDWAGIELTAPTVLVEHHRTLDAVGRTVELVPLPPGHTDNDLAVHLPDAGVWIVGDVVEQSGPPLYGSGCDPLGWPAAVRALLALTRTDDVIVPGHGEPVDPAFAARQAELLDAVAERLRDLHAAGLDSHAATASGPALPVTVGSWAVAVQQAYAVLGPA